MRPIRAIVCALAALAATAVPVRAETVVRWVSATGVPTWEPLSNDLPSITGRDQVYEGLTLTDADLSFRPGLATSWALVRPDTWRFELRQGVRFHDGSPLTAGDVVFSLDRARSETSEYAYRPPPLAHELPLAASVRADLVRPVWEETISARRQPKQPTSLQPTPPASLASLAPAASATLLQDSYRSIWPSA